MANEDTFIPKKTQDLRSLIHQYHEKQMKNSDALAKITNILKVNQNKELKSSQKTQLSKLYTKALKDAESEVDLLQEALGFAREIKNAQKQKPSSHHSASQCRGQIMDMVMQIGTELRPWLGNLDESPPPLCGAIPANSDHIASPGDLVAAFVTGDLNAWMLAEVITFDMLTDMYQVADIDKETEDEYHVSKQSIIPLPLTQPNPETHPQALFGEETLVLALYPQTTCFYRAVITSPPVTLCGSYKLSFEDNTYEDGYASPVEICQQYVIAHKDSKEK